jgi:hypothetical protein
MASDEANVVPFTLQLDGETTGTPWFGKFKAKIRLSLRDQLNRDKIRRELLGSMGGTPDDRALSIAIIISELTVRLVEAPPWWREQANGLDLEDGNVVSKVYDEAMKVEADALDNRKKKADEAKGELKQVQAEKEAAK